MAEAGLSGYAPGKYDQLAAAYLRAGHEQAARRVTVAKQRARRTTLWWPARAADLLLDITVLYGYEPWRALLGLFALVVSGAFVFAAAHPRHMVETAEQPPAFHPFWYALDVVLPIIDLRQQTFWVPESGFYALWAWISIGLGWALSTAVVVGMTGALTRRD